jgi:hypothetical protein
MAASSSTPTSSSVRTMMVLKIGLVASLIEACKLNDVEPQAYLADVLVRLVSLWPNNRFDELLLWTWAAARQQQQCAAA